MTEIIGRRRKRERSYVSIENSMFEDADLSYRAKGVLGYLLSKPDDWTVRVADLVKRGKEGRDAIYTALNELRDLNYLHYYQPKNSKGHWGKTLWEYDDIPFDSNFPSKQSLDTSEFEPCTGNPYTDNQEAENPPLTEKPYTEKPCTDNQEALIKNDLNKKDLNKKDLKKAKAKSLADKIISKKVFEKEGDSTEYAEILRAWDFSDLEISEISARLRHENLEPDASTLIAQCKFMFANPQVTGSKAGFLVNGIRRKLNPVQPTLEEAPRLSIDNDQLKALLDKIFPEHTADVRALAKRVYLKNRHLISLTDYQIILNEFKPKMSLSRNGNLETYLGGFIKNFLNPVPYPSSSERKTAESAMRTTREEKSLDAPKPIRTEKIPEDWLPADEYYRQFEKSNTPEKENKPNWKVNNLWD
jgi:hypothetical protein